MAAKTTTKTTTIKCTNIAPIENLNHTFNSASLKIGIYANNGSGKTFISRLFRMTEKSAHKSESEKSNINHHDMISFGKNKADFSFHIKDGEKTHEDFRISIDKNKEAPTITESQYIYHTFNKDYVDKNIAEKKYNKDAIDTGTIIMGSDAIDLSEYESKFEAIKNEGIELKKGVILDIEKYKTSNIDNVRDIRRLGSYKDITYEGLESHIKEDKRKNVSKSVEQYKKDFDKFLSIPENFEDIYKIEEDPIIIKNSSHLITILNKPYTLSNISAEFRNKINKKLHFIETGVDLLKTEHKAKCPFCEQKFNDHANHLIDNYIKYINDEEARVKIELNDYSSELKKTKQRIQNLESKSNRQINEIVDYKTKYLPSFDDSKIVNIKYKKIYDLIDELDEKIEKKKKDIGSIISDTEKTLDKIATEIDLTYKQIIINNKVAEDFNNKMKYGKDESISIRNDICFAAFNELAESNKMKISKILQLRKDVMELVNRISEMKKSAELNRKEASGKVIQRTISHFFGKKYSFDKETYQLSLKEHLIENNQTAKVLSDGEKSIIAFAYYLGDVYQKISSHEDFNKLFFIIDDPISSMDFNYVYTMCGIIRDIKDVIREIKDVRTIIFTHNSEFMRILISNNIVDEKLILRGNEIKNYNTTSSIPYVFHLLDIYEIANGLSEIKHTTANSIRHIIETLTKFKYFNVYNVSISSFIKDELKATGTIYTLIHDLSHGNWRDEQKPISEEDFKEICKTLINYIQEQHKGQIEYCKSISKKARYNRPAPVMTS